MARVWRGPMACALYPLRVSCLMLVILITSAGAVFAAEESPQSFTYQGRFLNAAGTAAIADGTYTVKFSVYDPAGSCLLYQESQSITTSNGFFSAQVGGAVADLKRVGGTDPSLSMQDVFSNKIKAVRPVAAPNCAAGYIPALGDGRKLRVENVTLGVVLTPDQTISSVPHAIVAESIQGIVPQNFVQIYPTGLPAAGTTLSDDTYAVNGANNNRAFVWDSVAGTWTETKVLSPRALSQEGAVAGKVLKWDASGFWLPGDDLDTAAGTMNGDVTGSYSATKVIALQNRPVAATAPGAGEVLAWDGSTWKPTAAGGAPSGAAGGDLSGTYPNPYVSKIHGIAITSSVPNSGDVLKYNGATWVYTSSSTTGGSASGDLSGTYPGPTVAKLQGNAIAAGAPTAPGQVLTWTGTEWAAASSNTLSDNLYVNITGDTMTGHLRVANSLTTTGTIYSSSNIQMNATAINGMADPTLAQDAATKMYVDSKLGSLNLDTTGVATGGTGAGKYLKWDGNKWIADTVAAGTGTVTAVIAGHGLSITGDSITTSGTITADTLTLSTRTYAASKLGGLDLDTNGVATGGTGTNYALKWDGNKWVTYDPQATNDARYVNTAGDTMTGKLTMNDNIIMAGHTITQLGLSSETDSATNKAYVDALIANVGGSMSDYVRKTGDTMSGLLNVGSSMHVTGNVGIGTTTPSELLELVSATANPLYTKVENTNVTAQKTGMIIKNSTAQWNTETDSLGYFQITRSGTGGNEVTIRQRLNASGLPTLSVDGTAKANGFDANSNSITNVLDPTTAQDAATKNYVDLVANTLGVGTFVKKTGDTMTGLLNVGSSMHVTGNVGIGLTSPTAVLHLKAGTATASTAPLKFTAGTNLTAVENGAMEFDGTDYFLSAAGVRQKIMVGTTSLSNYLLKTGDTMSGSLNMAANTIFGNNTSSGALYIDSTSHATKGVVHIAKNGGYASIGALQIGAYSMGTYDSATVSRDSTAGAIDNQALSVTLYNSSTGTGTGQALNVYSGLTNTSGSSYGTGIKSLAMNNSVVNNNYLIGADITARHNGNGTLTTATAGKFTVTANGLAALGTGVGVQTNSDMSGALTTLKHMEITNATGAGALTTQYGLYINSLTKGTGGNYAIYSVGGSIYSGGSVGLGVTSPTAVLHLKAGTAAANTAPLKFTSGTLQTTAEAGTIEYDGTNFYITPTAGNRVALGASSPKYFVTSGSAIGSGAEALCDSEATGYHVCSPGEWLGRGYDTGEATSLAAGTLYWVQAGGSCTGQKAKWDPTMTTTDFGWSMSTTTYGCGANSGKVVCCTD